MRRQSGSRLCHNRDTACVTPTHDAAALGSYRRWRHGHHAREPLMDGTRTRIAIISRPRRWLGRNRGEAGGGVTRRTRSTEPSSGAPAPWERRQWGRTRSRGRSPGGAAELPGLAPGTWGTTPAPRRRRRRRFQTTGARQPAVRLASRRSQSVALARAARQRSAGSRRTAREAAPRLRREPRTSPPSPTRRARGRRR